MYSSLQLLAGDGELWAISDPPIRPGVVTCGDVWFCFGEEPVFVVGYSGGALAAALLGYLEPLWCVQHCDGGHQVSSVRGADKTLFVLDTAARVCTFTYGGECVQTVVLPEFARSVELNAPLAATERCLLGTTSTGLVWKLRVQPSGSGGFTLCDDDIAVAVELHTCVLAVYAVAGADGAIACLRCFTDVGTASVMCVPSEAASKKQHAHRSNAASPTLRPASAPRTAVQPKGAVAWGALARSRFGGSISLASSPYACTPKSRGSEGIDEPTIFVATILSNGLVAVLSSCVLDT
jgi:hypothetical protein